jgi:hypothetical protein
MKGVGSELCTVRYSLIAAVDDEVEIQGGGKLPVQPPQEAQKLLMAVPRHALAHDGSFQHVESGE